VSSSNLIQLHQDALDDSEMQHSANTGWGLCPGKEDLGD
jgi:hypothetical protein